MQIHYFLIFLRIVVHSKLSSGCFFFFPPFFKYFLASEGIKIKDKWPEFEGARHVPLDVMKSRMIRCFQSRNLEDVSGRSRTLRSNGLIDARRLG